MLYNSTPFMLLFLNSFKRLIFVKKHYIRTLYNYFLSFKEGVMR
jgi:hypothetical protein